MGDSRKVLDDSDRRNDFRRKVESGVGCSEELLLVLVEQTRCGGLDRGDENQDGKLGYGGQLGRDSGRNDDSPQRWPTDPVHGRVGQQ